MSTRPSYAHVHQINISDGGADRGGLFNAFLIFKRKKDLDRTIKNRGRRFNSFEL